MFEGESEARACRSHMTSQRNTVFCLLTTTILFGSTQLDCRGSVHWRNGPPTLVEENDYDLVFVDQHVCSVQILLWLYFPFSFKPHSNAPLLWISSWRVFKSSSLEQKQSSNQSTVYDSAQS